MTTGGAGKVQATAQDQEVRLVPTPGTEGRYVQATFPLTPLAPADWDRG
jgi:hypothetical protein